MTRTNRTLQYLDQTIQLSILVDQGLVHQEQGGRSHVLYKTPEFIITIGNFGLLLEKYCYMKFTIENCLTYISNKILLLSCLNLLFYYLIGWNQYLNSRIACKINEKINKLFLLAHTSVLIRLHYYAIPHRIQLCLNVTF